MARRAEPPRCRPRPPDADRKPTVNADLVAPARFIAVPWVAYRLALAAVGDGEALSTEGQSVVSCRREG
jgi:hypothetical protein